MEALELLDGILFTFGEEGVTLEQLSQALEMNEDELLTLIDAYKQELEKTPRGCELLQANRRYKLVTKTGLHDVIASILNYDKARSLSTAALETLAIIAYKQPITRLEIEEIRGVGSDMMCRRLEALDLIKEFGRADTPGKPILYEVTNTFLDVFKLTTLGELPEINIEETEVHYDYFKQS